MPCTRHDLTQLAAALLKLDGALDPSTNEAVARAAMSRAYYAVYHLADELRAKLDPSRPSFKHGEGNHRALFDDLNACIRAMPDETDRRIVASEVSQFDRLRKRRILADYKLGESIAKEFARVTVDLARQTSMRLGKYL